MRLECSLAAAFSAVPLHRRDHRAEPADGERFQGAEASVEFGRRLFASNASNAIIADMAALQLDQKTKTRLRVRAAHHGRSMEEEAREILRSALTTSSRTKGNLAEAIRRRFASFGGIEISLPQRDAVRKAPGFEE